MKQNFETVTAPAQTKNPVAQTVKATAKRRNRLSLSMAFASVFALFLGSKASAQIATYTGSGGTSTSVTYYTNETGTTLQTTGFGSNSPCGSGGLSGITVSTVYATYSTSGPRVYFTVTPNAGYQLNVTSFSAGLRRSGTGPAKVRYAYSTNGGTTWIDDATDHAPNNGSCGTSATSGWGTGSLPTGVTGSIIFALFPFNPSASAGVFQVNNITIGGTITATGCTGTPTGGSATAATTSFCTSGSTTISLSGSSSGAGITYQWQSSPDNTTWSNISGATNNTYVTPTLTSTTYYRAALTCTTSSLSANSSSATVTINSTPVVNPITGSSSVIIGTPETLSTTTTGGTWSSTCTSIATVGTSGIVTGIAPGAVTISYTKTVGGCTGYATKNVTVTEPNTIAVYSGACGTGTGTAVTVNSANASVGMLTATGVGTTTPCSSGGFSGITVSTVYATYSAAGPHVYYQVSPASGYQLNITDIKAITRESGTGPTKARIAYSLDGGTTWVDDATDHTQSTSGSCGANTNVFGWTGGISLVVTTNVLVAVYPYAPGASGGNFQLNRLSVYGSVNPLGTCSGTPVAGTASVSGTPVVCVSGSKTINLSGYSTALGVSFQWQDSPDGITWTNITGATNTSYATPTLTTTTYYQAVATCSLSSLSANSTAAIVSVNPIPSAGTITGVPAYVEIGTTATLSNATTGGVWSSDHASIASVGSATGDVNGIIPGTANITYSVTTAGCTGTTSALVQVIHPNTIAAYLGTGGNSVATVALASVTTTTLTAVGFGTVTPCSSGGYSGLTNDGVTSYSPSNAHVYFHVQPNASNMMDITGFHVTLRRSNSGITKVRMAFSLDNGATWNDDGLDQAPDNAGCSNSVTDYSYSGVLPTGLGSASNGVIFAVYPYDPIANGGTIQVNSFDITGTVTPCEAFINPIGGDPVLCVGNTVALTEDNEGGTWSSSNPGVGTISASGEVTGIAAGTTTISYTLTDQNGCTGVATVVITVNPTPVITGIDNYGDLCVGAAVMLTGTPYGGTWSSSSTHASVDVDGTVNGNDAGEAIIYYTLETGCYALVNININDCEFKGGHATGVAATQTADVQLYPNPASAQLHIAADGNVKVTILSIDGKVVLTQNGKNINVSELTNGVYMVKIYDQNNVLMATRRFTKN